MRQWLLAVVLALAVPSGSAGAQSGKVYRIPVSGVIENGLAPYIDRSIRSAAAAGADAVILDIDTPGGRIDAAQRITGSIRESPIPVIAWVRSHALSAGAMIALAAEQIYMTPDATLGAATPVDGAGTKGSEKIVSAMRAEFRALAEARGRNAALAEAMVDESLGVEGYAAAGQLVTLTTAQAIDAGFAEGEAATMDQLLAAIGLPGAVIESVDPNWAEQLLRFLTHPAVSPLLLSLGLLGLVFEIKAGAFGLGGLVSVVSLGLFFGSSFLLGLAGWETVILLSLGLIALGVEVFVLPGFGVAGILGLLAMGAAVVMALVGGAPTGGDFVYAFGIMAAAIVLSGGVFYAWLRHLPNSERWSGLLLKDEVHRDQGYVSAPVRNELIGLTAVAVTDLRPSGTAEIEGERIDVVAEGVFIRAGEVVEITASEGYRHVVRPVSRVATNIIEENDE